MMTFALAVDLAFNAAIINRLSSPKHRSDLIVVFHSPNNYLPRERVDKS
jgi:hypothetical protein